MTRPVGYTLISIFIFFSLPIYAQQERRGRRGESPSQIFDNVAGKTNEGLRIQETRMNRVDGRGQYARKYRLANTLDSIRNNLSPYLQWMTYFGLTIATILIIYNGFLLVSAALHSNGDVNQVINRFKNIGIGLALLLGFWFIIKLAAIIINALGNQTF